MGYLPGIYYYVIALPSFFVKLDCGISTHLSKMCRFSYFYGFIIVGAHS